METLRPLTKAMPCYFVLGNHDWRYDYEAIRRAMVDGGWTSLGQSPELRTIDGWDLHLEGSELPWMGDRYDRPLPDIDVPFPDASSPGATNRPLLRTRQSFTRSVFVCRQERIRPDADGHTHGGQIVLPIIGPVYSPSIHGVRFASGVFEIGNMTLHVSRGIGGKDPLRWRCPPEMTILTLVSKP